MMIVKTVNIPLSHSLWFLAPFVSCVVLEPSHQKEISYPSLLCVKKKKKKKKTPSYCLKSLPYVFFIIKTNILYRVII